MNKILLLIYVISFLGCSSNDSENTNEENNNNTEDIKVLISNDLHSLYVSVKTGKIHSSTINYLPKIGVFNKVDDMFYQFRYEGNDTFLIKIPCDQFRDNGILEAIIYEEIQVQSLGDYWLRTDIMFDNNNNILIVAMNNAIPDKIGYGTIDKLTGEFTLTHFGINYNGVSTGYESFYFNATTNNLFSFDMPYFTDSNVNSFLNAKYNLSNYSVQTFSNIPSYGAYFSPNNTEIFTKNIDENFYFVGGQYPEVNLLKFNSSNNSLSVLGVLPNILSSVEGVHFANNLGKVFYKTNSNSGGFMINSYDYQTGLHTYKTIFSDSGVFINASGREINFID